MNTTYRFNSQKTKNIVLAITLLIIVIIGITAAVRMAKSVPTYNGEGTDVIALYEDPSAYDNTGADGVAAVIVNENNERTAADNVVFSVVFNFRGYDTLGESFILIAAIAGSLAILRKSTAKADKTEEAEVQ